MDAIERKDLPNVIGVIQGAGGIVEASPNLATFLFGTFAAVLQLTVCVRDVRRRSPSASLIVAANESDEADAMNMLWFDAAVRKGQYVSLASVTLCELMQRIMNSSHRVVDFRCRLRCCEKIFVNELFDIETSPERRNAHEWKGMGEVDLDDEDIFGAVLDALTTRARAVIWRELLRASDFEFAEQRATRGIRVQRMGVFGKMVSANREMHDAIERVMKSRRRTLFESRTHSFGKDGGRLCPNISTTSSLSRSSSNRAADHLDDVSPWACVLISVEDVKDEREESTSSPPRSPVAHSECMVVFENQGKSDITNTFGTAWGIYLDIKDEGPWVRCRSCEQDDAIVNDAMPYYPLCVDAVPEGWEWLDDWAIARSGYGECDSDGWQYGTSFQAIRTVGGSASPHDCDKRQRRWVRRLKRKRDAKNASFDGDTNAGMERKRRLDEREKVMRMRLSFANRENPFSPRHRRSPRTHNRLAAWQQRRRRANMNHVSPLLNSNRTADKSAIRSITTSAENNEITRPPTSASPEKDATRRTMRRNLLLSIQRSGRG